jgi:hypothetical protein
VCHHASLSAPVSQARGNGQSRCAPALGVPRMRHTRGRSGITCHGCAHETRCVHGTGLVGWSAAGADVVASLEKFPDYAMWDRRVATFFLKQHKYLVCKLIMTHEIFGYGVVSASARPRALLDRTWATTAPYPSRDGMNRKEDTMIVLVIGFTATLGFLALGMGGFVLSKPLPARRGDV